MVGCAGTAPFGGSRQRVEDWAAKRGFRGEEIAAGGFALYSMLRGAGGEAVLPIYIEGDGASWPSPYQPPLDPTPPRPLALALAAADGARTAAYLARPCQYLDEVQRRNCDVVYWSKRRFAPEVVEAMDRAVSRLKLRAGAHRVRLVGHSGGGVIAVLLAMRRDDVAGLITVAAPLALSEWTAAHDLSALDQALDPMAQAPPSPAGSVHFAGGRDAVVPPDIVAAFAGKRGGRLEVVAEFDHECCWARDWPQLLRRAGVGEMTP
jgi:pimeloyl-ACP methyl ester carboxylesterase